MGKMGFWKTDGRLLCFLTALIIAAVAAWAPEVHAFSGAGTGVAGDPYIVTDWDELNEVRDDLAAHYELANDLDDTTAGYAVYNTDPGWDPIGTFANPFTGVFDGGGFSISDLFINRGGTNNVGLFARIEGAEISNLELLNVDVTGNNRVGGLVGVALEGSTISNVEVEGSVAGTNRVGGLAGRNEGTITVCWADADVAGANEIGGLVGLNDGSGPGEGRIEESGAEGGVAGVQYAGGLVGRNWAGTVLDSSAAGDVAGDAGIGGLAGWNNEGTILDSSASGKVTGTFEDIGGLAGINFGLVSNSHAYGDVDGGAVGDYIGGLAGYNDRGTITGSSAQGDVEGRHRVGGLVGLSEDGAISDSFAAGGVAASGNAAGGLVGRNFQTAISDAYAEGDVDGDNAVGGLVGWNDNSAISNSHAAGEVTAAGDAAGGLVGANENGAISKSYALGAVTAAGNNAGGLVGENEGQIANTYARGAVHGDNSVGGLIGDNLAGSTILNSFATGRVTRDGVGAGGLVGVDNGAWILASFYDTETAWQADTGKGEPRTTAQMQDIATYAGWSIQPSAVDLNDGYPYLHWQAGNSPIWYIFDAAVQTGALRVAINPAAVRADARWRRDGGPWREHDETEMNVPVGNYTVEFNEVAGWVKPADIAVTINANVTTARTGTYTEPVAAGSITVTINPEAVRADARWRLNGGAWREHGQTADNLPVGEYTVEFNDVAGWNTPADVQVEVEEGVDSAVTGTYTQGVGSLTVTILPSAARDAGAMWRRKGTDTWRASGTTETDVPAGEHTVEFKDVDGWDAPEDKDVTVNQDLETSATGTYMPVDPDEPPGVAALVSPEGVQANLDLTYRWQAAPGATWYRLWINRDGVNTWDRWYKVGVDVFPDAGGMVSVYLPNHRPDASYEWWVQAWNPAGYGQWSAGMQFTTEVNVPGVITLMGPIGSQQRLDLTYMWRHDAKATWYRLWVRRTMPGGGVFNWSMWYRVGVDVFPAADGSVSVYLPGHFAGADYEWWVQGWAPAGYGPWSSVMLFNTR